MRSAFMQTICNLEMNSGINFCSWADSRLFFLWMSQESVSRTFRCSGLEKSSWDVLMDLFQKWWRDSTSRSYRIFFCFPVKHEMHSINKRASIVKFCTDLFTFLSLKYRSALDLPVLLCQSRNSDTKLVIFFTDAAAAVLWRSIA